MLQSGLETNLFDAPLFPIRETAGFRFLTLEQVLRSTHVGNISHPFNYLSVPARLLAQAMLQLKVAQHGLRQDLWADTIIDETYDSLADHLFPAGDKIPRGFDLFGDTAFMQLPRPVMEGAKPEVIEGVFQPFRARRNGEAKALRSARPMAGICRCCAAVGVFSTQVMSGAMSQYWGAAPTSGSVIYGLELNTVSRSLLANVIHGSVASSQKGMMGLPWVPTADQHGGFEKDGRMPFEKHLTPARRIRHIAEAQFPFVRGTRLIAPAENDIGRCDACGRDNEPLIREFVNRSESALIDLVADSTKAEYERITGAPLKKSGLLAATLHTLVAHPSLAYITRENGKDDEVSTKPPVPQGITASVESITTARPAWVQMADAFGMGAKALPLNVRQYAADRDIHKAVEDHVTLTMFGVRFVTSTDANPLYILDEAFGAHHLLHSQASAVQIATASAGIAAAVEKSIYTWARAAQRLEWDVSPDPVKGFKLDIPKSKKRQRLISELSKRDSTLRTEALHLWSEAQYLVENIAGMIVKKASEHDVLVAIEDAKKQLRRSAHRSWETFMSSRQAQNPSLKELFVDAKAEGAYRALTAPKNDKSGAATTTPTTPATATKKLARSDGV